MAKQDIYATPRAVTDIGDCFFYHTMDLPGYGTVEGAWDLRKGAQEYLGGVVFKDKRVLEIGTASGFLCFYMEGQGADVVAYDLSENQSWDVVPYSQCDHQQFSLARKAHIHKINNAFWLSHRVYGSSARMVYGSVYSIPEEIGMVDISTFGCVLLHTRDPFLALENALRLTRETVIVTDVPPLLRLPSMLFSRFRRPCMYFWPKYSKGEPKESWWSLSPEIILNFLGVLGFEKTQVKYHTQRYEGRNKKLYTIVGHRTSDIQSLD
jgi:hypothetical protein